MHPVELRREALRLLDTGMSLDATSKRLGVSRAALREWRELPDIRGRARGRHCPRGCDGSESQPLGADHAALLGFYLGDGCLSDARTHFVLRVSCDAAYPGIIADITQRIEAVHPGAGVCHVSAPGAVVVQNCWKHWPCLFPQHGPGRKHERILGMQPWQWAIVEEHPGAFLRGLFHSDGCRTNNWTARMVAGERKRYDYPRWQFVNESAEIRQWCCDALDLLDIPWRQSNRKTISVSTRAGVARLDELVGPKT